MLNEIRQSEELRNRRLVDLYEEGILELGDEVPYIHEEKSYVSVKEKNGFAEQEFFSSKGLDMKWQTIGVETVDSNKCIKLIAKEPVFNVTLRGARGCVYGIDEMHKICSLFATGDGALKGRSITIEDVNKLLGVVVDEEKRIIYQKGYSENINENIDFLRKNFFDKEFYTPEGYLAGEETQKKQIIETYYWYKIASIIGKEKERDIVCRNINYFLASPGVLMNSGYAIFGPGAVIYGYAFSVTYSLFYSYGLEENISLAVRPILYLKPNETFNSLLGRKENISGKDKFSFQSKSGPETKGTTRLRLENLLKQLEVKRQEEEEIIRQIKKLIK